MILIIDDDPSVCTSLKLLLKQAGHPTRSAANPAEALTTLENQPCELVLQDMNFSRRTDGQEGLTLLRDIKQNHPSLPVILMTAWGSISLAVEGMRIGAADFITKPWTHTQIINSVQTVLGLKAAGGPERRHVERMELDERYQFSNLVGQDPAFLEVLELIGRVAATDAPVLITGESGTGKEEIAAALHHNSRRRNGPFVKVNLGGLATNLFESEMFGHVKGAFTDARNHRVGRFESASGGSIFLDEIGDLDGTCQVKLLRVLQDRTFEPLGSSKPLTVDVRIVAATNKPLAEMVANGSFREDLYYRLNLIEVQLPALRNRRGDIPRLAKHFLQRMAARYNQGEVHLTEAGYQWLSSREWPGNIRELKQMVERCVLISGKNVLDVQDFQIASKMQSKIPATTDLSVADMTLDEMEQTMIERALRLNRQNISQTAQALGLSRAALYRRMEKYGISP